MGLRTWACLMACLILAGCSTDPGKCPHGYKPQGALCVPNFKAAG